MRILASDIRDDNGYLKKRTVLIKKKLIARNAQDQTDTSVVATLISQK